jgi:hypothetical protein
MRVLLILFKTRPLQIARENKTRTREPLIETLVELVPVDEEIVLVKLGVRREVSMRSRCCGSRGLAAEIWIERFIANGEDFYETLLGGIDVRIPSAGVDFAADRNRLESKMMRGMTKHLRGGPRMLTWIEYVPPAVTGAGS